MHQLRFPNPSELRGEHLYGDDFTAEEIRAWYEDEQEAYADLMSSYGEGYRYAYHAANARHGFLFLPPMRFAHALGIGSAYGHEFAPIQDRLARVTIIESSVVLRQSALRLPVEYIPPSPSGKLPLDSSSVDLVLCLGVLHHIANVSTVIAEIARVLETGGYALMREPTVSMGDWTQPRRGLTPHERGIPLHLLRRFTEDAGMRIERITRFASPLAPRIARFTRLDVFASPTLTRFDELSCRLLAWNTTYHATRLHQRVRPTSAYLVAVKR
jgi:SAM-dependent methyltransferase